MVVNLTDMLKSCTANLPRYHKIEVTENDFPGVFDSVPMAVMSGNETEMFLSVTRISDESSVMFSLDAKINLLRERPSLFESENALSFELDLPGTIHVLGNEHRDLWWMKPQFCSCISELKPRTQGALLETEEHEYIYLLPLNGDNCYSELSEGKVSVSVGSSTYNRIKGSFLCASVNNDPYKAIENAYRFARLHGGIRGKLLSEKEWPEQLKGLGMCTWDMCYHELCSEKVYQKLDELRDKNIPVNWFMFDNGWLCHRDGRLYSFRENKEKFPEGFAECVRRMKEEYGIKYVGVWHTFSGYWLGIEPDSELYLEQKDNLETMPGGQIIPSIDEEKSFRFWDAWHSYMENCGFDFVKVDSQSTYPALCEGSKSNIEYTRSNQKALEKSVYKHFGGGIINCMGMDMENVLERETSISRSSGDFNPRYPERFFNHLYQNVWNSLWHNQLYFSDFDMFWSDSTEFIRHEGVIHAISGGPVYISDAIGVSNYDNIRPCILEDGSLPLMDHAALPAKDIIFSDCIRENRLFKIWNTCGNNFALALFTDSKIDSEKVELTCIPGVKENTDYLVYEYFSGSFRMMKGSDPLEISLTREEVRAYSVMPVENGQVEWGDNLLYFPIADPERKYVPAETLCKE